MAPALRRKREPRVRKCRSTDTFLNAMQGPWSGETSTEAVKLGGLHSVKNYESGRQRIALYLEGRFLGERRRTAENRRESKLP